MVVNFFGTYGIRVFLSFVPLILYVAYILTSKSKTIRTQEEIKKRYTSLNKTLADKSLAKFIQPQDKKKGFINNFNAKMNILGIEYKFETLAIYSIFLFFITAVLTYLLIGAGPLLMLYFGFLGVATIYVFLANKMEKRTRELREEFIEKLRDIGAHLSVGINFQTAISETLNAPNTTIVMARELGLVRDSIYQGEKYSLAFLKMYERLQIKEIKEFSQVCFIYEETGGQFVTVIHAFQDSYKRKRVVIQENEIFEASMKNEQKFVIGIPILCIVGYGIFLPDIIRTFYSSFFGQIFGIVLFTVIYAGILLMSRFVRFGGDE